MAIIDYEAMMNALQFFNLFFLHAAELTIACRWTDYPRTHAGA